MSSRSLHFRLAAPAPPPERPAFVGMAAPAPCAAQLRALQTTNAPPLQSSRSGAYTRRNAAALDRPDAFCKRRVPSRPRNDALHAGEEAPKGLDRTNRRCRLRAPMGDRGRMRRRARSRPSTAAGRPAARRRRAPRPSNAPWSRASSTTNGPNITLVVIALKTADRKSRLLRVITPLGVLLPTGLSLRVDKDDLGRMNFVRCLPNGCVAEVFLDDKLLGKLESGVAGDLRPVRDARGGRRRADSVRRVQGRVRGAALTQGDGMIRAGRQGFAALLALALAGAARGGVRRQLIQSAHLVRQFVAAADQGFRKDRQAAGFGRRISTVPTSTCSTAVRRPASAAPPTTRCAISSTLPTSRANATRKGGQFALKVGVAGQLLIGPAGSPGAYSTTLRVQVKRDIDNKILYDKTFRVAADTSRRRPSALSRRHRPDHAAADAAAARFGLFGFRRPRRRRAGGGPSPAGAP